MSIMGKGYDPKVFRLARNLKAEAGREQFMRELPQKVLSTIGFIQGLRNQNADRRAAEEDRQRQIQQQQAELEARRAALQGLGRDPNLAPAFTSGTLGNLYYQDNAQKAALEAEKAKYAHEAALQQQRAQASIEAGRGSGLSDTALANIDPYQAALLTEKANERRAGLVKDTFGKAIGGIGDALSGFAKRYDENVKRMEDRRYERDVVGPGGQSYRVQVRSPADIAAIQKLQAGTQGAMDRGTMTDDQLAMENEIRQYAAQGGFPPDLAARLYRSGAAAPDDITKMVLQQSGQSGDQVSANTAASIYERMKSANAIDPGTYSQDDLDFFQSRYKRGMSLDDEIRRKLFSQP